MDKGIAITTIVLFLVGIVVAGVLIYLVYSSTTSPVLSSSECQARLIGWCTNCKNKAAGGTWPTTSIGALDTDCRTPLSKIGIAILDTSTCANEQQDACSLVGVR